MIVWLRKFDVKGLGANIEEEKIINKLRDEMKLTISGRNCQSLLHRGVRVR